MRSLTVLDQVFDWNCNRNIQAWKSAPVHLLSHHSSQEDKSLSDNKERTITSLDFLGLCLNFQEVTVTIVLINE